MDISSKIKFNSTINNEDDYIIGKRIGNGTYGSILECSRKSNNKVYAMKRINMVYDELDINKEENFLKLFKPYMNLCCLIDTVIICDIKHIIMPLYNMNLLTHINSDKYIVSKEIVLNYSKDILNGLKHLKHFKIIHGDLKPENIMLDGNNRLFIIDFGLSNNILNNQRMTTYYQSRWYRSPNIILGKKCGYEIDIWSFGCIFSEIIDSVALFMGKKSLPSIVLPFKNSNNQLLLYIELLGVPSNEYLKDCQNLYKYFNKNYLLIKGGNSFKYKPKELYLNSNRYIEFNSRKIEYQDKDIQYIFENTIRYEGIIDVEKLLEYINNIIESKSNQSKSNQSKKRKILS